MIKNQDIDTKNDIAMAKNGNTYTNLKSILHEVY